MHYFPGLHATSNPAEAERFEGTLRRYITRKIGFEAVMRIRCTRGRNEHFTFCCTFWFKQKRMKKVKASYTEHKTVGKVRMG